LHNITHQNLPIGRKIHPNSWQSPITHALLLPITQIHHQSTINNLGRFLRRVSATQTPKTPNHHDSPVNSLLHQPAAWQHRINRPLSTNQTSTNPYRHDPIALPLPLLFCCPCRHSHHQELRLHTEPSRATSTLQILMPLMLCRKTIRKEEEEEGGF
jgi:hypothetical protein